jgi:hypothetical protein
LCKHAETKFKQDPKEGRATLGKIKATKTKKFIVIEIVKEHPFDQSKWYVLTCIRVRSV